VVFMKGSVFCDMLCSLLKSQLMFQKNISPPSLLTTNFLLVSCLAYSLTLKMAMTCSTKMLVDFSGLHGIMLQKLELFMLKLD
jgi:hypothetical protein